MGEAENRTFRLAEAEIKRLNVTLEEERERNQKLRKKLKCLSNEFRKRAGEERHSHNFFLRVKWRAYISAAEDVDQVLREV